MPVRHAIEREAFLSIHNHEPRESNPMNEFPSIGVDSIAAKLTNSEAAAKASELKTKFEELCRLAPEAAGAALGELTTCGERLLSAGKEKALKAGRQVVTTVRQHPVESTIIAALAVFGVWSLIKRK